MRYGFKSVTMSDIARELGISKKTLYQFVDNKNDLILKVVKARIKDEEAKVSKIHEEAKDAIDEMLAISFHVNQNLKTINPAAIFDLQKYYRDAWDEIQAHRVGFVFNIIKENILRGVKQGLYRENIDVDIISKIYIGVMLSMTDTELFPYPQYNSAKVYEACVHYHIYGIVSLKGLELLKKYANCN